MAKWLQYFVSLIRVLRKVSMFNLIWTCCTSILLLTLKYDAEIRYSSEYLINMKWSQNSTSWMKITLIIHCLLKGCSGQIATKKKKTSDTYNLLLKVNYSNFRQVEIAWHWRTFVQIQLHHFCSTLTVLSTTLNLLLHLLNGSQDNIHLPPELWEWNDWDI